MMSLCYRWKTRSLFVIYQEHIWPCMYVVQAVAMNCTAKCSCWSNFSASYHQDFVFKCILWKEELLGEPGPQQVIWLAWISLVGPSCFITLKTFHSSLVSHVKSNKLKKKKLEESSILQWQNELLIISVHLSNCGHAWMEVWLWNN
jgi:hypothetical protein